MPIIETRGSLSSRGYGQFAQSAAPAPTGAFIEDVFSTWLYTGNGSTQTITNGIDLATKGGLVWIKDRDSGAKGHALFDTVRGVNRKLQSQSSGAQFVGADQLTAFNANGFSLGSSGDPNGSGTTYASWTFAEQPKFFDVVTFTSEEGGALTFNHSLGSQPGCVIVKTTGTAQNWLVYHRDLVSSGTTVGVMNLNATSAVTSTAGTSWNAIATTTTFRVPSGLVDNQPYVAYLFAHNAGGFGASGTDNVISCGSYTEGSTEQTINLGYEAQWLLIKTSSTSGDWYMYDTMRGFSETSNRYLLSNSAVSEAPTNSFLFKPAATGFIAPGNLFGSGTNIIYIAIRRGPMRTPTSGTSVFAPVLAGGTEGQGVAKTTGFPVDLQIFGSRSGGYGRWTFDRLRGVSSNTTDSGVALRVNAIDGEMSLAGTRLWGNTGYQISGVLGNILSVYWNFRRAPGFFDVVCYTGTGVTAAYTHNLGVAPELLILKKRNAVWDRRVYVASLGNTNVLYLNDTAAVSGTGGWNNTTPTSTQFTVASGYNTTSDTYVAYLFASCPGVSKVGTYTGTGSTVQVDCGFTAGARFVLIKRTDASGSWYVWDSARGIIAGNDPYLLLNSEAAEVTSTDWVDTLATGFEVSNAGSNLVNVNGGTYIFLAIA